VLLKKIPLVAGWNPVPPLLALMGLIVLRPLAFAVYTPLRAWPDGLTWVYLGAALLIFLWTRKVPIESLGLTRRYLKEHLALGVLGGAGILAALPLLDVLIDSTALAGRPLFLGAQSRALDEPPLTVLMILKHVLLVPAMAQTVLVGWLLGPWLQRLRPLQGMTLGGLVFPLAFWDFTLGRALLGFLSALFYYRTGSLTAPFAFHVCCALAGLQLIYVYPRVVTLLGFLL